MPKLHFTATAVTALLMSCSAGDPASNGGATAAPGATHFLLTDDPFPYSRVARVDLYVVSIAVSSSPDTSAMAGGSFVTVASPHRAINVLALQNGAAADLGALQLPHGAITSVQLTIDTDSSSITLADGRVLTGHSSPGIQWQSSAGRPVITASMQQSVVVPDSGATVVIDYDVGQAFIAEQILNPASTDSSFVFSPVFRVTDATRSASIVGAVHAHSAAGAPVSGASLQLRFGNPAMPAGTWATLATAQSDGSGNFRFAYVLPTDRLARTALANGVYMLIVDPPAGAAMSSTIVSNVPATVHVETNVGAVILP